MSDSNRLTDRAFWVNYWESKENLIFRVPEQYPFLKRVKELMQARNLTSLLEIGGFPGYYSVAIAKELGVKTTLLDFVVHQRILNDLEQANGLPKATIGVVEGDVFRLPTDVKYQLVMSNGLIEHFTDTKEIIERHVAFLEADGSLFISLPNFKGLNGWFQKTFDPDNYAKHNIDSMDIDLLRRCCEELGLRDIKVQYNGGFMLWLENPQKHSSWVKLFQKAVWLPFKIFFKIVPIETKWFSPYIVIEARK